jgi:hypothetical protein
MRLKLTILGHEVWCLELDRDEPGDFDFLADEDEEEYDEYEDGEEEEESLLAFRWGYPATFERQVFSPVDTEGKLFAWPKDVSGAPLFP